MNILSFDVDSLITCLITKCLKTTDIIIIIKKVWQCKAESNIHRISPKTTAPQYQPIDRKKRKGKRVEAYNRDRAT